MSTIYMLLRINNNLIFDKIINVKHKIYVFNGMIKYIIGYNNPIGSLEKRISFIDI